MLFRRIVLLVSKLRSIKGGLNAAIEDATASGISKHYETTLERVGDYYGIVARLHDFRKIVELLKHIEDGTTDFYDMSNMRISAFLEKHKLIDLRAVKQSRVSKK